jgi:hypothetical protein
MMFSRKEDLKKEYKKEDDKAKMCPTSECITKEIQVW